MNSKYPQFKTPVEQRVFDASEFTVQAKDILPLPDNQLDADVETSCRELATTLLDARQGDYTRILFFGGHLIKLGLQRYIQSLLGKRVFTHLATNGAGLIHDFELAAFGATSQRLPEALYRGGYGVRDGIEKLNDLARDAASTGEGYGERVGRYLCENNLADNSVFATAYSLGVPVTVHPLLGADTTHILPSADWAKLGKVAQTDFKIFTHGVSYLVPRGVFVNMGSAVHGPEVFLKALGWVVNAHGTIDAPFNTAVFDMQELPANWRGLHENAADPLYYFRPWRTLLRRVVKAPGMSWYVQGDLRETVPLLWRYIDSLQRKTT